ncbi:MAG: phosphonate ABC transporter ATP-binding protein [Cetobacterium sp.]|uniref:phosphonate ABC transporter ATP-binding protein n=1 Tax=Cetobacterium sp. ZOR0034 TaxID=1339239 RepID=UPI000647395C|nr:phosphonate ABC transporter ATP-binding protein [Cetobacterium sp. ZOR0034]
MENIVSIKNGNKTYDNKFLALSDINLDIKKGEFVAIIGSSGAGKSTLLRSINAMNPLSSGAIIFNGKDISKISGGNLRKVRREMGMIFQHYNLIERLSVVQNVLHGRLGYMSNLKGFFELYSEEDKEKALNILKRLGLEDHCYKKASELSGGQKQRVGISRALAQNPKLILADEPIASLDPKSSEVVMETLKNICVEDNLTCIVNLHQVEFAKQYATRIIGMNKGQIIFDDIPENLTEEKIGEIYGQNI